MITNRFCTKVAGLAICFFSAAALAQNSSQTNSNHQADLLGVNVDAGVGAGFGMNSSGPLWDLGAGYIFKFSALPERLKAKALFDVNFGHGSNSAQYLAVGGGVNYYLGDYFGRDMKSLFSTLDLSLADATSQRTNHSATSASLGLGLGTTVLNLPQGDVNLSLHYSFLMAKLDNSLPSVLSARIGLVF